ncbi:MAG: HNH endonuclease [Chloroflexi bacterium CFX4]|nr:HNH endonuclease [Chloroflexi bacterium CFX4]MDL1924211.1 HNH endonuclease [Chloroflexi bacterium CFX3]
MTYLSEALRRQVVMRAGRICEYCLLPESAKLFAFEVDHIISEKHRGETNADNLCLSCLDCNRYKGSDIASLDPESGVLVRLFNPRHDVWHDHFKLDGARIEGLTPEGRVTVFLLRLNAVERVSEGALLIEAGVYPPQREA